MTVLVVPTCSSELFCVLINTRFLGRIQVFTKWGPVKGAAEGGAPVGDPREMLKFVVLGNAISGILRQSQRVTIS